MLSGFLLVVGANPRAYCQEKKGPTAFEVVSIKVLKNPSPNWQLPSCRGHTFLSRNTPIRFIAEWAYAARSFQFTGKWPPWAETPRYFIEAKTLAALDHETCRGMVRDLLADAFKLSLRREKRNMNVFALVVGSKKRALRRVETTGTERGAADEDWAVLCDAGRRGCIRYFGRDLAPTPGVTMDDLAYMLSGAGLGRPVVDRTGLAGRYAFTIRYDSRPDGVGDDIVSALDRQLGLKLVKKKELIDVFEFVHVEPSQVQ